MSEEIKLYCVVDRKRIPHERIIQRSPTCSPECANKLRDIRKEILNQRKCLACFKPSTPEMRHFYRLFKLWCIKEGHLTSSKGGRGLKKSLDAVLDA